MNFALAYESNSADSVQVSSHGHDINKFLQHVTNKANYFGHFC